MEKAKSKIQNIREAVEKIEIKPRNSTDGQIQREAFRIRWGKRPEQI